VSKNKKEEWVLLPTLLKRINMNEEFFTSLGGGELF
jgi:hypothetical protein